MEWGADASSFFYLTMDDAHRPHKAWRHVLGTPQSADECLVAEDDDMFWMGLHKSRTGAFVVVDASSKTTSEVRLVPLTAADGAPLPAGGPPPVPVLVTPRREGVLYEVEHWAPPAGAAAAPGGAQGGWLVVVTNDGGAKNFKVAVAPVATPGHEHWRDVVPHSRGVHVTGVDTFRGWWAVYGRQGGYKNVWLVQGADVAAFLAGAPPPPPAVGADAEPGASGRHVRLTRIPARDDVYVVGGASGNVEYDATSLRFAYGSPVTPTCTCEYAVAAAGGGDGGGSGGGVAAAATGMVDGDWAGRVTVLKQKEVPNCNPADYATRRIFATATVRSGEGGGICATLKLLPAISSPPPTTHIPPPRPLPSTPSPSPPLPPRTARACPSPSCGGPARMVRLRRRRVPTQTPARFPPRRRCYSTAMGRTATALVSRERRRDGA